MTTGITPAQRRPRVIAIIQARMGSTRLPGKALRKIAGRPLLWHIIHRLRGCQSLTSIAVATSDKDDDNAIADFCRDENVTCIRGPEENVLERFALAAARTKAGIIVRVCSDSPFIDASFVDHLVTYLIEQDGDYVRLEPGAICAHCGVDVFSRCALDKLLDEAADDHVAREHVAGYFTLHPDFVRTVYAAADPRFAHAGVRLSIDTPDDLAFVEALYERLHAKAGEASLADLLLFLEREPQLNAMNAHVRQKALDGGGGMALLLCDGGGARGFGHVRRCLSVAQSLRNRNGFGAIFALNGDQQAALLIREAGFETLLLPGSGQGEAVAALAAARKPDMLICDACEKFTRAELANLASKIDIVAVIDDGSDRRLAATHAYYPPVPQAEALTWEGTKTAFRIGWEWAVLGFDPSRVATGEKHAPGERPKIVVSMGGSDPFDLTRTTAHALAGVNARFTARFVIGPGFTNPQELAKEIESLSPSFQTVQGDNDPGAEFATADIAVIAFGVTAYEVAALGVPALYLAISDDHALSASAFEYAGMGVLLGLARDCSGQHIAKPVWNLLRDPERRRDMRAAGLANLDGKGAERIADDLNGALMHRRVAGRASA